MHLAAASRMPRVTAPWRWRRTISIALAAKPFAAGANNSAPGSAAATETAEDSVVRAGTGVALQPGMTTDHPAVVYWHRELPPLDGNVLGEHVVEATSHRVPHTLAHRDELWNECYRDLMEATNRRIEQEVSRLSGRYAHVLNETIDSRHDDASGESWLRGRFTYTLLG
jgi:hypothetical protein